MTSTRYRKKTFAWIKFEFAFRFDILFVHNCFISKTFSNFEGSVGFKFEEVDIKINRTTCYRLTATIVLCHNRTVNATELPTYSAQKCNAYFARTLLYSNRFLLKSSVILLTLP